jgi:hypothetical protein
VDLAAAPRDEEALAKRAKEEKQPVETYPHIADVQWVTKDHFLVKPMAAATGTKIWQEGVFELFNLNGTSLGRRTISYGFNPDQDSVFLRGSVLVVVRSGKSALLASIGAHVEGSNGQDYDEIIVEAYDLTP